MNQLDYMNQMVTFYSNRLAAREDVGAPSITNRAGLSDMQYLDRGNYGRVYSATCQDNNQHVAVKVLYIAIAMTLNKLGDVKWNCYSEQSVPFKNLESLNLTIFLYRKFSHPYIVSILDVVDHLEESEIWIITELLNGGSLRPHCTEEKRGHLTVAEKTSIGVQCLSALCYLHKSLVSHKDLKPDNILVPLDLF